MSTLAFNISQFFPLLNHQLLPVIFNKVVFDKKIFLFFSNHLINRKTQYVWNNFISSFFTADVDMDQESTLSPILSAFVRHGSHRDRSPQNRLGDERTCGTALASAYVLCRLSAMWSQLQMKKRKSEWK